MKKFFCTLLAVCCLASFAWAADSRFSDVGEDHWAYEPICQAAEAGAVTGFSDGTFRPGDSVTGVQFCAMLARTFLSGELEKESVYLPWQTRTMNVCASLLSGTSLESAFASGGEAWSAASAQALSRYDMAQILCQFLEETDAPSAQTLAFAGSALEDWERIPVSYRNAVAVCLEKGLMQGQRDGCFQGGEGVNRGQACAVWARLLEQERRKEDAAGESPEEAEEALFVLREGENLQQMMNRVNQKTPLHPEGGVLSNGEAISEENIQSLLEQVKAVFPDGTRWTSDPKYHYSSPRIGYSSGCLSFGLAVSDFLFGEDAGITQHRNFQKLKAGDVVTVDTPSVYRVLVILSVDEDGGYTACSLQRDGKMDWSEWGSLKDFVDRPISCIYSRY